MLKTATTLQTTVHVKRVYAKHAPVELPANVVAIKNAAGQLKAAPPGAVFIIR